MNDQNDKWNKIWGQHVEQMKNTVDTTHSDRNLKAIGEVMEQIKAIEAKTYAIQGEIGAAEKLKQSSISDEELSTLKQRVQTKVSQYKILLNDKSALFEEMHANAVMMINRDK